MEERYEALSLIFGDCPDLKKEIITAIDQAKEETGLTPFIFERVLELLEIDKCESGLC